MARRYEYREQPHGSGTIILSHTTKLPQTSINIPISPRDGRTTSEQNPYTIVDIAHVATDPSKRGRLTVSISPGKCDHRWNRNLEMDLKAIKRNGITVIVCLLEWSEMRMLEIIDYPRKAEEAGFLFYHLPIKDCSVPTQDEINVLIPILVRHLVKGHNILIHCREGLGRAGTICACCLIHFGFDGKTAIDTIRRKRPGAIQTSKQEECVLQYHQGLCVYQSS